ncbi:MAG: VWA domain-containing protein [Planctomycetota bacterium]|nr:VWA domain-containing protein [Planctomycetota bacterium]
MTTVALFGVPFKFLTWQTGLLLGAIAVPSLLLLYFLKLRRQERTVSSTLLWQKAIHDLQVNAPFQKLRKNLLLLLQLLILAAVLFGLSTPVANLLQGPKENIVLLIDRSASMKVVEADGRSRLEHAKEAAEGFVDNLPDESRAMVISFADRAGLECRFTNNRHRLISAIQGIEATDAVSNIGESLQLAVAYSSQLIEDAGLTTPQAASIGSAGLQLYSDGRITDADQIVLMRGTLNLHKLGKASDNVGIVAFDVRPNLERPGELSVFAQIENFGPDPIKTDVSIRLDGRLLEGSGAIKELSLGGARPADEGPDPSRPTGLSSAENVIFKLIHDSAGIVEVRIHRKDALAADNVARAPIDAPRRLRVLVVTKRSRVKWILQRALSALTVDDVEWMSPDEYENAPDEKISSEGRSNFDLVIFDAHSTDRLAPGNYLFFGAVPKVDGFGMGEMIEDQRMVNWLDDHPLIRPAELHNVMIFKWRRMTLPNHAEILVEGEDSAIIVFASDPGHRYLMTAFDLLESDIALKVPFMIIFQNAVRYMAGGGLTESRGILSPGQTLTIPVPPGANEVRITAPGGVEETISVMGSHSVTYAKTQQAGIYRFEFDDAHDTTDVFAANILNPTESRVAPVEKLVLTAGTPIEIIDADTQVNEPLWPYAAAVALLILLFEWWVYNKRMMI